MNLNFIVGNAINAITPKIAIDIWRSAGYFIAPGGIQTPYFTRSTIMGDVQALSGGDLRKLEGLNVQGVSQKIYLNGDYEGVVRNKGEGGDIMFFNGAYWLVTVVMERWADWVCLGLTQQTDITGSSNFLISENLHPVLISPSNLIGL